MALTLRDYFPHYCYFTNRLLASFLHKKNKKQKKQAPLHNKTHVLTFQTWLSSHILILHYWQITRAGDEGHGPYHLLYDPCKSFT